MRKEEEVEEPEDSKLEMVRLICNFFSSSDFSFQFYRIDYGPDSRFHRGKKKTFYFSSREKKKKREKSRSISFRSETVDQMVFFRNVKT